MKPPVLRTILDLSQESLTKELSPAQINAMQMFRSVEQKAVASGSQTFFATARQVVSMPGMDRAPTMVMIMAHRLNDFRPQTLLSPLMLGVVSAAYGSPGAAVQWAHAMAAWHARHQTAASVATIIDQHLGGCLPDEAALLTLWEGQKRRERERPGPDNWLDYPEAWTDEALCAAQVGRGESQFVAQSSG